jgi:hypothetical protein
MMDYLTRGMDPTAYFLPFIMRFDEKISNTVATLIGQGDKWPTDDTAHLGRDAWMLAGLKTWLISDLRRSCSCTVVLGTPWTRS